MKLVLLIPSYNRPARLAATLASIAKNTRLRPDDVIVYEQPAGQPDGMGKARRVLCEIGIATHGFADVVYLMLDDDSDLSDAALSNVRWAMDHFHDHPFLGVCQLLNNRRPVRDAHVSRRSWIMHSFLIRGWVFGGGPWPAVNYVDGHNISDETLFSIRAYLAGWDLWRTDRARVPHDMLLRSDDVYGQTPRLKFDPRVDGGNEAAVRDGVACQSRIWEWLVEPGHATVGAFRWRGEYKIPNAGRLVLTPKAHDEHAQHRTVLARACTW